MTGKNFDDISMKRSGKVLPLADVASAVKVGGEAVVIDQQQMLNRLLAVRQSGSEPDNFIQSELVNCAPFLFDIFSLLKRVKQPWPSHQISMSSRTTKEKTLPSGKTQ